MQEMGRMKARRMELTKPLRSEPEEVRAARIREVIEKAKAAGEKIPPGVHLIGTREPTETERAFGATLEQQARGCLERGADTAA